MYYKLNFTRTFSAAFTEPGDKQHLKMKSGLVSFTLLVVLIDRLIYLFLYNSSEPFSQFLLYFSHGFWVFLKTIACELWPLTQFNPQMKHPAAEDVFLHLTCFVRLISVTSDLEKTCKLRLRLTVVAEVVHQDDLMD